MFQIQLSELRLFGITVHMKNVISEELYCIPNRRYNQ